MKSCKHPLPFEGNPAASSFGWLLFSLNLLLLAYISTVGAFPIFLSKQLATFYATTPSNIIFVSSYYFYALTLFHIPAALLVDKYRTSSIVIASLLLMALGLFLLSHSHTLVSAGIAFVFLGIGSAPLFPHALKCLADWFPPKAFAPRFGLLFMLTLTLTFAGIFLLKYLRELEGWRHTFRSLSLASVALAVIAFFLMRRFKEKYLTYFPQKERPLRPFFARLFDSSQMWLIGLTIGISGVFYAFLSQWALPVFTLAYQASKAQGIFLVFIGNVGFGLGTFLFASITTLLKQRKLFICWGLAAAACLFVVLIYLPSFLPGFFVAVAVFLLGLALSAANLGYVIIHEQNAPAITATASATVNVFHLLAIPITGKITAVLTRIKTTTEATNLLEIESTLSRIPIYFAAAFLLSFFIRETRTKQFFPPED